MFFFTKVIYDLIQFGVLLLGLINNKFIRTSEPNTKLCKNMTKNHIANCYHTLREGTIIMRKQNQCLIPISMKLYSYPFPLASFTK